MKLQRYLICFILGIFSSLFNAQTPIYKDKNANIEKRVNDLLKRMTPEEKFWQITQNTLEQSDNPNNVVAELKKFDGRIGSIIYFGEDPVYRNSYQKKAMEETRLGIPILFANDIIHGCKTLYPIGLATGASWNPPLYQEACSNAAKEAYLSGFNWVFAPMIDIARDPRWGRVSEGFGEDPYTTGVFCSATVKGFQGEKLSNAPYKVAACMKHYVAYGLSEGGRDYTYSDVSPQTLWETYLPPYKAGIDAGATTVMSAFNDISGIPATINKYTLTDVLKTKWGFKGFVVSDWGAIHQLISQGVAKDDVDAGRKALMAGLDMDMLNGVFTTEGNKMLDENKITQERLDDAVKRILTVKFTLGLFDEPYTPIIEPKDRFLQPNTKKTATELAEESMVLLKNENNILPLNQNYKSIAIIGPIAKDTENVMGNWIGRAESKDVETIFAALTNEFKDKAVLHYAKGCNFDGSDESDFKNAIETAQKADVVLLFLGEKSRWSGENASRSTIALPEIQEKLMKELQKTGKKIVLVLSNGRPLTLANIEPLTDGILEMWQPGTCGASAVAGILSGRVNPSGKLPVTFPYTTGQIPLYYNMRTSARPEQGMYLDLYAKRKLKANSPLYPFGFGLSYTHYQYGNVQLSATKINKNQKITATVEVINNGSQDGKETVHWYISQPVATISRPAKELKFFEKKLIKKGEKAIYKFEIDPKKHLWYYNDKGDEILESGDFYLIVGEQKVKFTLE